MLVIDAAMILKLMLPPGAFAQSDLVLFAVLYGSYLVTMALATWPARPPVPPPEDDFQENFPYDEPA